MWVAIVKCQLVFGFYYNICALEDWKIGRVKRMEGWKTGGVLSDDDSQDFLPSKLIGVRTEGKTLADLPPKTVS